MKMHHLVIAILSTALIGSIAYADDMTPPAAPGNVDNSKPCKAFIEACKAAGYTKGDKQGKGLILNCVIPLINGNPVNGVNVTGGDANACKAKMDARRAQKAQQKSNQNAPMAPVPVTPAPAAPATSN